MNAERSFVILKCVKKVPILGGCTKCPLKFLTPKSFHRDSVRAEQYLLEKFDIGRAEEHLVRAARWQLRFVSKDKVELLLWRSVCVNKTMTLDQAKTAYLMGWTKLLPKK